MAGRERDPDVLRNEAQELMKRARKIEERRFKIVGHLLYEHHKEDYVNFNLDTFRKEVKDIINGKKKGLNDSKG